MVDDYFASVFHPPVCAKLMHLWFLIKLGAPEVRSEGYGEGAVWCGNNICKKTALGMVTIKYCWIIYL